MKKLHTLIIAVLGLAVISCSQKNLAQVENDDMYFSKKDRKEVTAQEQLAKQEQNQVVRVEPQTEESIVKETVPQQQEEFYDSSKDPDYVPGYHQSGQESTSGPKVSDEYYVEDNGSYKDVARSTAPLNNNYYFYGRSPYSSPYYSSYNPYGFYGAPYGSSISLSFNFGGAYGRPYYDPFYSGFNSFYSPFYSSAFYGPSSFYGGYRFNSFYGSPYCYYPTAVPYNSYVVYEGRSTYNGRNVVPGPRRSRGAVSPSALASRTVVRQISSREGRINGGNIDNDVRSSSRVTTASRTSGTLSSYRNRGTYQPRVSSITNGNNGTRGIATRGNSRSVQGRNAVSTTSGRSTGVRNMTNTNRNKNNSAVNRSNQRNGSVSRNVSRSSTTRNSSVSRRNTGFLSNSSKRSGATNRSRSIGSSNRRNKSSGVSSGRSRSRSSSNRSSVNRSSGSSRSSVSRRSSVSPSRSSSSGRSRAPSRSSGSKSSSSRSSKKN